MTYLEYRFTGLLHTDEISVLLALLDASGFIGFEERGMMLVAYTDTSQRDDGLMDEIICDLFPDHHVSYEVTEIPMQNWNKEWERNFSPVHIEDRVCIRAGFHPMDEHFQYDIVIEPKMSFGTGHHPSTRLMIQAMLELDLAGKKVLDMGCGTAVLSILASKMGAGRVTGVDIDEWAFRNSIENLERNSCGNIEIKMGGVEVAENETYGVVLANINRNVLLEDMQAYEKIIEPGGKLVLSGFLEQDAGEILSAARKNGLKYLGTYAVDRWNCIVIEK